MTPYLPEAATVAVVTVEVCGLFATLALGLEVGRHGTQTLHALARSVRAGELPARRLFARLDIPGSHAARAHRVLQSLPFLRTLNLTIVRAPPRACAATVPIASPPGEGPWAYLPKGDRLCRVQSCTEGSTCRVEIAWARFLAPVQYLQVSAQDIVPLATVGLDLIRWWPSDIHHGPTLSIPREAGAWIWVVYDLCKDVKQISFF